MESSMAKLSSGQKVNSAADDAAGLAIASRMTAQIRGLAMAVKNSNDSMSLAQTAEGAMEEVTNMLQRIRELAVQSANGTMNSGDRASLDAEVQALKAEIDRVATTTTFNSQNLLDGSYKATFQIGDKGGQTVGLQIGSVLTSSLGMGEGASGANSLVSDRVAFATVVAGDIEINGQALGAIASTDHMEDVVKNINDNVDNVVASAFNVVVAENVGNGVTGGDGRNDGSATNGVETGMLIKVREQGVTADTTFTISASSNMDELVANINNETGGVVVANLNDDGKLVLSNSTGATITVEDDSTSGSGFSNVETSFTGFLKLDAVDDEPIRITKGNKGLASPGADSDLAAIGFRETKASTLEDGYTIMSASLTSPQTALAQGDLFINGVEIFDEDIVVDSFTDKLALINSKSAETGVTASAFFERTFTIDPNNLTREDIYEINGHEIQLSANTDATVADLVTQINSVSNSSGIEATANGNNVTLTGENVQTVTIGRKTQAEIEDTFDDATTIDLTAGSTTAADVTIVLHADDAVEGRTYRLNTVGGTGGISFSVTYTAAENDTNVNIMAGLRDALINKAPSTFLVGSAGVTLDANNAAVGSTGTLKIDADLGFGKRGFKFGLDPDSMNDAFGLGSSQFDGVAFNARLKLDSVNNSPIKIDLGQNTTDNDHAARHGLLETGVGAADFDVNEPTLSAAGGSSMSGLTVGDAASATKALGTIDNAIDTVNNIRGDLGALQNRLEYTINNLSSISNATTGARGRILDADFAKTTSELTKHQILTQAATSMLAQANQSKQGILALLQG
jgi:flagellin